MILAVVYLRACPSPRPRSLRFNCLFQCPYQRSAFGLRLRILAALPVMTAAEGLWAIKLCLCPWTHLVQVQVQVQVQARVPFALRLGERALLRLRQ